MLTTVEHGYSYPVMTAGDPLPSSCYSPVSGSSWYLREYLLPPCCP